MMVTVYVQAETCVLNSEALCFKFDSCLPWFCSTTLCDWLPNFVPVSQPMRSKTKTNRASLARVFARLAPVACICFEFWLHGPFCCLHLLWLVRVISLVLVKRHSISEFRGSETARSWARIRDKINFSPHEHTYVKEVSVEFP